MNTPYQYTIDCCWMRASNKIVDAESDYVVTYKQLWKTITSKIVENHKEHFLQINTGKWKSQKSKFFTAIIFTCKKVPVPTVFFYFIFSTDQLYNLQMPKISYMSFNSLKREREGGMDRYTIKDLLNVLNNTNWSWI